MRPTADPNDVSFSGQLATARTAIPQVVPGKNDVKSVTDAVAMLYQYPPDRLAELSQRMYAAGFYPPQSYAKGAKPPSGKVLDDYTRAAAINLFQTTVGYNGTKSVGEVLDAFSQAGVGADKMAKAQQSQGHVYNITTDDPATLRATVTKVAQSILGRSVTDDEQSALVDQMMKAEAKPAEAAIQAGEVADTGGDVRLATARVDAQAQLEEQLKAKNPLEAGAFQELNYYNVLSQALKGPV